MKYKTSDKLRPPPHTIFGDHYERTSDPWHNDGFVGTPMEGKGNAGPRKMGWSLIDAWGNEIGWFPDGDEFEVTPQQLRAFPPDLRDALMEAGAEVMAKHYKEKS